MEFPALGDLDLAYETGLHIGDGNLTRYPPHYRYVLSGNRTIESVFYRGTVVSLIRKLYGLKPSIYVEHNSIYATTYSKALVLFKHDEIGLPIGPKDSLLCLPTRIMSQGKESRSRVLSGLYDADGSPKVRKTPSGDYPRISLAQKIRGVVEDVRRVLAADFGISSTLYRNGYFDQRTQVEETRWFLDINGQENLSKFMASIGSRHPNVLRRLRALSTLC